MTTIVGLDLSLASTGVAVLRDLGNGWARHLYRIRTRPEAGWDTKKQGVNFADKVKRMWHIRGEVGLAVEHADLVVIEGPSYASQGSAMHDLGGVWFFAYQRATNFAPVVVVSPSELKKWATGSGSSGKAGVARAVGQMWPTEESNDDNELDALGLASMGAQVLKLPVPFGLPGYRVDAVSRLHLPEELEIAA